MMPGYSVISRIIAFVLCFVPTLIDSVVNEPKDILILGGNGLLGGHATRRLHSAGHQVTIIHRGNNYWDWATLLKGQFKHLILCDRKDPLYLCDDFLTHAKSKPRHDIVIDFSGFSPAMLDNVLDDLKGFIQNYIFISTDSVYELAITKSDRSYSKEEDAVRPASVLERLNLANKDQFGENKLRCEEKLKRFAEDNKISVLSLRLPDVLGPRDSTIHVWSYMIILEMAEQSGQDLHLPSFASHWPISFVYADDVARLLVKLAGEKMTSSNEKVTLEAVNFGSPITMTLTELLEKLTEIMGIKSVKFQYAILPNASSPRYLIPSVTRGPIDVSLAQQKWKFKFTPWDSTLRTTVRFYQQKMKMIRSKKQWNDSLVQRLHANIKHLDGLKRFDNAIWQAYLKGNLKPLLKKKDEL